MVKPGDRKTIAAYLTQTHQISIARACNLVGLPKSMFYYSSIKDDSPVIDKLSELVELKPTRGFPYYFRRIRNEGIVWNHKRVKRVYKLLNLNKRRKHKRRLPQRYLEALCQPASPNLTWSIDFMHDTLMNGRKVRVMNIIDDYNREALAIKADYSQSGHSLVKALKELAEHKPLPVEIRCDNGPEFLSHTFVDYCNAVGIRIKYIQPGKPTQNAFIERFNRTFREDILDAFMFESLYHLRKLAAEWMEEYNNFHPHQSLNNLSPLKYLEINHQI